MGLVDDKIYIFGGRSEEGYEDIQAQVFDLKTQTWQVAANPTVELQNIWMSLANPVTRQKNLCEEFRRICFGV